MTPTAHAFGGPGAACDPTAARGGLPDPDDCAELYADTLVKRGLAWVVDVILITLLSLLALPLTLFTTLFWFPLLYASVGFAYRVIGLARHSATPGMRLLAVEFRDHDGRRFDLGHAFAHVAGYTVSLTLFPVQLVSIVLMATTPKGQGLTDLVLGSAAINRSAAD